MSIKIGADSWEEVHTVLKHLLYELDTHPDGVMKIVSGGVSSGFIVDATVNAEVTPDKYQNDLVQYLAASRPVTTPTPA